MDFTLTQEKIKVTNLMMENEGFTYENRYGIPIDPRDISKGVEWKPLNMLEDEDYDKLEDYFLNKD